MDEIVLFILEDIKPEAVYFTTVEAHAVGSSLSTWTRRPRFPL
jgi:hypothetical protein